MIKKKYWRVHVVVGEWSVKDGRTLSTPTDDGASNDFGADAASLHVSRLRLSGEGETRDLLCGVNEFTNHVLSFSPIGSVQGKARQATAGWSRPPAHLPASLQVLIFYPIMLSCF